MKTLAKALFTTMLALSALSIAKADDDHEFIFSLKGGASYIPVTADAEINMGVFLTKNLSANLGIRFQETGEEYISGERLSYEWSFNERIYNMLFPLSIRGILPICKNEKRRVRIFHLCWIAVMAVAVTVLYVLSYMPWYLKDRKEKRLQQAQAAANT